MDDSHIQEAAAAVDLTAGFSSYLYGLNYSVEQYMEELDAAVTYIKSQGGHD